MPSNGDTIVVGVDGSECSDAALRWAIEEAERSGRSLLLVNARHWTSDALSSLTALFGSDDSLTMGRKQLNRAARLARTSGVMVRTRLVEGARPARSRVPSAKGRRCWSSGPMDIEV